MCRHTFLNISDGNGIITITLLLMCCLPLPIFELKNSFWGSSSFLTVVTPTQCEY